MSFKYIVCDLLTDAALWYSTSWLSELNLTTQRKYLPAPSLRTLKCWTWLLNLQRKIKTCYSISEDVQKISSTIQLFSKDLVIFWGQALQIVRIISMQCRELHITGRNFCKAALCLILHLVIFFCAATPLLFMGLFCSCTILWVVWSINSSTCFYKSRPILRQRICDFNQPKWIFPPQICLPFSKWQQ